MNNKTARGHWSRLLDSGPFSAIIRGVRTLFGTGTLLMAFAVALGAFGAHALKNRLNAYSLEIYDKAAWYHFLHAMALMLLPIAAKCGLLTSSQAVRGGAMIIFGILLFSGSLYLLAITGQRWLGAITPLGGTAFIIAWLYLSWITFRS